MSYVRHQTILHIKLISVYFLIVIRIIRMNTSGKDEEIIIPLIEVRQNKCGPSKYVQSKELTNTGY